MTSSWRRTSPSLTEETAPGYRAHDYRIDQGDIFRDVPFLVRGPNDEIATKKLPGIVTSHGCYCERYDRALEAGKTTRAAKIQLYVCPITSARNLNANDQATVREGKNFQYHALPVIPGVPEMFVDATLEQSIPARLLETLDRTASLTETEWIKLVVHQTTFRFRREAAAIFRPDLLDPSTAEGA